MAQMLQKLHHDDVAFKTARHYIIIFFVCYFLEIFRFKITRRLLSIAEEIPMYENNKQKKSQQSLLSKCQKNSSN